MGTNRSTSADDCNTVIEQEHFKDDRGVEKGMPIPSKVLLNEN